MSPALRSSRCSGRALDTEAEDAIQDKNKVRISNPVKGVNCMITTSNAIATAARGSRKEIISDKNFDLSHRENFTIDRSYLNGFGDASPWRNEVNDSSHLVAYDRHSLLFKVVEFL